MKTIKLIGGALALVFSTAVFAAGDCCQKQAAGSDCCAKSAGQAK